jgi:hypothetical protein
MLSSADPQVLDRHRVAARRPAEPAQITFMDDHDRGEPTPESRADSEQKREAHMKEAAATDAHAPLIELLAAPFRATVISQLPCRARRSLAGCNGRH